MTAYTLEEIKNLKRQLRETRKEMRTTGVRRISCFNGGLGPEEYRLNSKCYQLETRIKSGKGL